MKLLLKIWPALLPWLIYFLWVLLSKKFLPFLKKKNFLNRASSHNSKGAKADEGRIIDAEYVSHSTNQQNDSKPNDAKASFANSKHFIILLYLSLILAIISVISFAFQK